MTTTPAGWHPAPDRPGEMRYWDGVAWTDQYAPAAQQQPPRRVVSDAKFKPAQLTVAWVIAVLTAGYMLPWAIAATRGKSNSGAIGLLNLLLGWTIIGWIVALVMACGSHQQVAV